MKTITYSGRIWLALAVASGLWGGCDRVSSGPGGTMASRPESLPPVGERLGSGARQERLASSSDLKARQVAFLNRLREADPQQRTIDRALLNEQNELGLILDRRVAMNQIPSLLKTMMAQMALEFPGQDLTVVAYAPSEPPRQIGVGRLNARTREMTYTAARQN